MINEIAFKECTSLKHLKVLSPDVSVYENILDGRISLTRKEILKTMNWLKHVEVETKPIQYLKNLTSFDDFLD